MGPPVIGLALLNAYGSTLPVSLYAAAMTGPGLVSLGLAAETAGRDLDRDTDLEVRGGSPSPTFS